MPPTIIAWDSFQARARPLPRLPRRARGSLKRPPKTSPNGANNDCPRLRCRRQPSDQPQDREGGRPGSASGDWRDEALLNAIGEALVLERQRERTEREDPPLPCVGRLPSCGV